MSRLEILRFPDSRLRRRAEPVRVVDDEVRRLIDDMLETMYDAPGIGLSALRSILQGALSPSTCRRTGMRRCAW